MKTVNRRRTYARLIGEIQHALNEALTDEYKARGLTRSHMAEILGKDKSFVTRKLSGNGNMTLETLADLAYALDRPVRVSLPTRQVTGNAPLSQPPPVPKTSPDPHKLILYPPARKLPAWPRLVPRSACSAMM